MNSPNLWPCMALVAVAVIAPPPSTAGNCPLPEKQAFGNSAFWPDNDPDGVWLGPAPVPDSVDGTCMLNVGLSMVLQHARAGDIEMELWYDRTCDGDPDVGPVVPFCRPGRSCTAGGGELGCESSIDFQLVQFRDTASEAIVDACGGATVGGGCYLPSPDSPRGFDVFEGEPKGGCFWLFVADHAPGATGLLKTWAVETDNILCALPTEASRWSTLKARF